MRTKYKFTLFPNSQFSVIFGCYYLNIRPSNSLRENTWRTILNKLIFYVILFIYWNCIGFVYMAEVTFTDRGFPRIFCNGHPYGFKRNLVAGQQSWICTMTKYGKRCKAAIRTKKINGFTMMKIMAGNHTCWIFAFCNDLELFALLWWKNQLFLINKKRDLFPWRCIFWTNNSYINKSAIFFLIQCIFCFSFLFI